MVVLKGMSLVKSYLQLVTISLMGVGVGQGLKDFRHDLCCE